MAMDMPAETQAAHNRWQHMWSHREQLLKVARRRSMSAEDAEDAVHEAMLRAAERPDLDDERLAAWLTTVTMRLCVDRHRQVNREAEVRTSPMLIAPGPVPVEEAVCDRAEARWLAVRSGELPARQAEALRLKSEDLNVGEVALKMGLSYRTVESLLARARRTLRNSLAGTLGLALFLCGRGRPRAGGHAQSVVVASTAATLAVAVVVLPFAYDGAGQGANPRPAVSGTAQAWDTDGEGGAPSARPHELPVTAPAPGRGPTHPRVNRPLVPLSLPEVSLSPVPALPAPKVPSVPDMPSVPDVTQVPKIPDVPDAPDVPNRSALPAPPGTPATPSAPVPASDDVPTPSALP